MQINLSSSSDGFKDGSPSLDWTKWFGVGSRWENYYEIFEFVFFIRSKLFAQQTLQHFIRICVFPYICQIGSFYKMHSLWRIPSLCCIIYAFWSNHKVKPFPDFALIDSKVSVPNGSKMTNSLMALLVPINQSLMLNFWPDFLRGDVKSEIVMLTLVVPAGTFRLR